MQPAARAGATFTTLSMKGKLKGVMAPTTPTGSRKRADPVIPLGPPGRCPRLDPFEDVLGLDGVASEHPDGATGLHVVGEEPDEPVSATMSSRNSSAWASRYSAMRTSAAARSAGLV